MTGSVLQQAFFWHRTSLIKFNKIALSLIIAMLGFVNVNESLAETKKKTNPEKDASSLSAESHFASTPVVTVIASRHHQNKLMNSQFVSESDAIDSITSVSELLTTLPGVTLNGQPGLFQTINIRGVARQRVLLFIDGVRITSERRAGVAASFLDPSLIQFAEVNQGSASTFYGSGALGGSVHLNTKTEQADWFDSGISSAGNEVSLAAGSHFNQTNVGLAFRDKSNTKTPQGDTKNNHFSQFNLLLSSQYSLNDFNLSWRALYANANDIGKDNLRYSAQRVTEYPEEKHLIVKFKLDAQSDWSAQGFVHEQSLITQDTRLEERINRSENQSTDFGFTFDNRWNYASFDGQFGIDLFSRQQVEATETEVNLQSLQTDLSEPLQGASDTELAAFITVNTGLPLFDLYSGARANYQVQKSDLTAKLSDQFSTYFFGLEKTVSDFNFSLGYSTGFRFASLSERLFSGITARGNVIGNPDLKPERSRSLDFGIQYKSNDFDFELTAFQTKVDNLIERISLNAETKTFRNSVIGNIKGWQYQVNYALNEKLKLRFDGQKISGKNQAKQPISDIPSERHSLQLTYLAGAYDIKAGYTRRLANSDFGDGELPRDSANIMSASVNYYLNSQWQFRVSVSNLLNESYFASADDLATMATQRSVALQIKYRQ